MIASEAITLLQAAELKQLGVKTDAAAVLGFINFGILELHKRFLLWEAEAVVTQATDVTLYKLDGLDSNVAIDLSDHSLMMIEKIYDEDDLPYVINDEKDEDSLSTPKPHSIKVPVDSVVDGYEMTVTYRAAPKFLAADTEEIPLPVQFLDALFTYVAYKGHLSIKSGLKEENNTHYIRFEASCNLINSEGLFAQKDLQSNNLAVRGFV